MLTSFLSCVLLSSSLKAIGSGLCTEDVCLEERGALALLRFQLSSGSKARSLGSSGQHCRHGLVLSFPDLKPEIYTR